MFHPSAAHINFLFQFLSNFDIKQFSQFSKILIFYGTFTEKDYVN